MLSNLLLLLLLEPIQPSYPTLLGTLPATTIINAYAQKNTAQIKSEKKPFKKGESIAPLLEAAAVYAIEVKTGTTLFVKDIFTRRPIASIAKLVTAMVILDSHRLDEKVIVSKNAADQKGSTMWLKAGEEITVEALLTGMLVNSGNDAAVALAEFDAGSEEGFVKKMNAKTQQLGLQNTHFSNAKGFDENTNYSTAYDTMVFSRQALEYPFIRKTVVRKTGEVRSASGKTKHLLENTNELLENPYFTIIGLKTGRSPGAGQSVVALAKGPRDYEILTILLDSPHRFRETKILLDWILRNYDFHLP